jgi:hypothetical protein
VHSLGASPYGKIAALVTALLIAAVLAAGSACGGDACQTLATEFAMCGGSTTSTTSTTGTSSGGGGSVCSDKEKMQAQCVLDVMPAIDLCKIKSKMASDAETKAYNACYGQ